MTNKILIVLCGVPGSGKSTFRKYLKQEYPDFLTISSDDYIESHAKSLNTTYDKVFSEAVGLATKRVEEDARLAITKEFNVIWDQTNLTVKKRKNILDKFENYVKIGVQFDIPADWYERLYKRVESEGKYIPYGVLQSMKKTFEPVTLAEGFNVVLLASPDYVNDHIREVLNKYA